MGILKQRLGQGLKAIPQSTAVPLSDHVDSVQEAVVLRSVQDLTENNCFVNTADAHRVRQRCSRWAGIGF